MSEREFLTVFAKRLRYYLNENGMTQKDLAERLGVGTTSVYNWLNEIKSPRMDKVDQMCKIFGCNRSDLLSEEQGYYLDPKTAQKAQEAYEKYGILFDAAEGSRPQDIQMAVDLLNRLKETNPDG